MANLRRRFITGTLGDDKKRGSKKAGASGSDDEDEDEDGDGDGDGDGEGSFEDLEGEATGEELSKRK